MSRWSPAVRGDTDLQDHQLFLGLFPLPSLPRHPTARAQHITELNLLRALGHLFPLKVKNYLLQLFSLSDELP